MTDIPFYLLIWRQLCIHQQILYPIIFTIMNRYITLNQREATFFILLHWALSSALSVLVLHNSGWLRGPRLVFNSSLRQISHWISNLWSKLNTGRLCWWTLHFHLSFILSLSAWTVPRTASKSATFIASVLRN